MDFAEFLKSARIQLELSQSELSRKIGVTNQIVYRWEAGHAFPSRHSLEKISGMLQIPINQILRLKQLYKKQRFKNLILNSKDPVVSQPRLGFVPLLDVCTASLPREAIKNPQRWKSRRCFLPDNLYHGHIFGFEISDNSMQPKYISGDVVLVDMMKKTQAGHVVIIKIKGHPPLCRLYSLEEDTLTLKAMDGKNTPMKIKKNRIEWCFGILD